MSHLVQVSEIDHVEHLMRRVVDATQPPPPPPAPPIIRVEDWGGKPLGLVVRYINVENDIDFLSVYRKIRTLRLHPGRGRREAEEITDLRMKPCSKKFRNTFWTFIAMIMDYLADFFETDSVMMQSLWMDLIDEIHEVADLPHEFWEGVPHCSHAQEFSKYYAQSLEVFNTLITSQIVRLNSTVVSPDKEESTATRGCVGSFKAGLKPWQQFLYEGSPGFGVPRDQRVYDPPVDVPKKTKSEKVVPLGALAIIHTHYERTRKYARACSQETKMETDYTSGFAPAASSMHTIMETQGQVVAPFTPGISAQNAPVKKNGLVDPDNIKVRPSLALLDEDAGKYRRSKSAADTVGGVAFKAWHVFLGEDEDAQAGDP